MVLSKRREALIRRLRHRGGRRREGLFLVEGVRAAGDALRRGGDVRFAVCSPRLRTLEGGEELAALLASGGGASRAGHAGPPGRGDVIWVDDATLEDLSDTETPQGVLLVCREPTFALEEVLAGARRGLLVLDGVQDPGNLGTLIRAAAAFGLGGVLALDGTVDPWNPKAVRAAAGTLFSTPVLTVSWKEAGPALRDAGTALVVADAASRDVATYDAPARWALVVGNEGRGVRPAVARAADATVGIPMPGGAESLNVGMAGAVLLYALTSGKAA